ncbi:Diphthamide biosynthesis protein 1 [Stygiomarasmius scandens]|uniref:2-(3-amino-3-carboxypropyl)histidine synthase subunit 1 n=1 Tax=Marasmiellus scandens TaxID=2682957 RepID=A0ABR1K1L5_9AGAR
MSSPTPTNADPSSSEPPKEPKPSKPKKSSASAPRRRFVGAKTKASSSSQNGTSAQRYIPNQIPPEILEDPKLNHAIKTLLPSNYSFEIHKTIHHIRKNDSKMVALQMPEGLQMFACVIADIIEQFTSALTTILGDVTYGACCVDDYTARALGCDMLIHYGHSCLVPLDQTTIKTLYVFVEIQIDSDHLEKTIRMNFPSEREVFRESVIEALLDREGKEGKAIEAGEKLATAKPVLRIEGPSASESTDGDGTVEKSPETEPTRLALVSTIQFVAALQKLKEDLSVEYPIEEETNLWRGKYSATIPRAKPLSPGEILGCTAPRLGDDVDALIYLGDGRFHLESVMIANPTIPAFRYDPYSKKLTREKYDHIEMRSVRRDAVRKAQKSITGPGEDKPLWGVVLGTLGRQGSFRQLQAITKQLSSSQTEIPYMPILLSELSPAKLGLFNGTSLNIATFVQTSCPRLSIDWGYAFDQPLLSPYETAVAVGSGYQVGWMEDTDVYPMDFYSATSPWAVSRVKGMY